MSRGKYAAPPTPLEAEAKLKDLVPPDAVKDRQRNRFFQDVYNRTTRLDVKNAVAERFVQSMDKSIDSAIDEDWKRGYEAWLLGRSTFNDPVYQTWWGKHNLLHLPEVKEFLLERHNKHWDFRKALIELQTWGPRNQKQAYLYYKYIVRAREWMQLRGGPGGGGPPPIPPWFDPQGQLEFLDMYHVPPQDGNDQHGNPDEAAQVNPVDALAPDGLRRPEHYKQDKLLATTTRELTALRGHGPATTAQVDAVLASLAGIAGEIQLLPARTGAATASAMPAPMALGPIPPLLPGGGGGGGAPPPGGLPPLPPMPPGMPGAPPVGPSQAQFDAAVQQIQQLQADMAAQQQQIAADQAAAQANVTALQQRFAQQQQQDADAYQQQLDDMRKQMADAQAAADQTLQDQLAQQQRDLLNQFQQQTAAATAAHQQQLTAQQAAQQQAQQAYNRQIQQMQAQITALQTTPVAVQTLGSQNIAAVSGTGATVAINPQAPIPAAVALANATTAPVVNAPPTAATTGLIPVTPAVAARVIDVQAQQAYIRQLEEAQAIVDQRGQAADLIYTTLQTRRRDLVTSIGDLSDAIAKQQFLVSPENEAQYTALYDALQAIEREYDQADRDLIESTAQVELAREQAQRASVLASPDPTQEITPEQRQELDNAYRASQDAVALAERVNAVRQQQYDDIQQRLDRANQAVEEFYDSNTPSGPSGTSEPPDTSSSSSAAVAPDAEDATQVADVSIAVLAGSTITQQELAVLLKDLETARDAGTDVSDLAQRLATALERYNAYREARENPQGALEAAAGAIADADDVDAAITVALTERSGSLPLALAKFMDNPEFRRIYFKYHILDTESIAFIQAITNDPTVESLQRLLAAMPNLKTVQATVSLLDHYVPPTTRATIQADPAMMAILSELHRLADDAGSPDASKLDTSTWPQPTSTATAPPVTPPPATALRNPAIKFYKDTDGVTRKSELSITSQGVSFHVKFSDLYTMKGTLGTQTGSEDQKLEETLGYFIALKTIEPLIPEGGDYQGVTKVLLKKYFAGNTRGVSINIRNNRAVTALIPRTLNFSRDAKADLAAYLYPTRSKRS